MSTLPNPSRRLLRAGIILLLGWIALEIALMQLVAARIGWAALILLMTVKGGIGLLLVGAAMIHGLRTIAEAARRDSGQEAIHAAGFTVASAILLVLPGIAPAFLALALFSPSLRKRLLALWRNRQEPGDPREIELAASEWKELGNRKPARRTPRKPKPPETLSS
ncbi:MAG: FxsA family protein [Proteobacteria bacterium]|nr:FxsA family protein [Pseudomonadota bacterium]